MQFTASDSTINFINPWVTGTAKVYHYEQPFNEDQGKNYWDDDSEHGGSAESGTLVDTITFDIDILEELTVIHLVKTSILMKFKLVKSV